MSWNRLRATRAARPGFAAESGVRGKLYGAAMEQAEQLFTSAGNVGVATSPLLLFYGTAQLARAVVAASPKIRNDRATVRSHGAQTDGVEEAKPSLLKLSVKRSVGPNDRQSSLTSLALALDACALEEAVGLVDLISSVPVAGGLVCHDTRRFPAPTDPPVPMAVMQHGPRGSAAVLEGTSRVAVGPIPEWILPEGIETRLDRTHVAGPTTRQLLQTHLDHFPSLSGWTLRPISSGTVPLSSDLNGLLALVDIPLSVGEMPDRIPDRVARSYDGIRLTFPSTDGCGRPQHPLVSWWAILLAFSTLARYHPERWAALLNIDRNDDAASIEHLLEPARREIPALALSVLRSDLMTPS